MVSAIVAIVFPFRKIYPRHAVAALRLLSSLIRAEAAEQPISRTRWPDTFLPPHPLAGLRHAVTRGQALASGEITRDSCGFTFSAEPLSHSPVPVPKHFKRPKHEQASSLTGG